MKKLKVTVNGTVYEVEVEELKEGEIITPKVSTAPVVATPVANTPVSSKGEKILAPMPGNIWKLMVNQGQAVKKGEPIIILEAMKMQNEILSPCDGTIISIHVTEGSTVDTDAIIAVIG